MFKINESQQLRLDDPIAIMPKYLKEIIDKSWATDFKKHIFSKINEDRFSVLFSEKASRPNSPVNVVIGLLIIKELFNQTDEELIGSLYFDTRYQYALNTTSYNKQPVSINTLTNFRKRLYNHLEKTGIDLIKLEVEELAENLAKLLNIKGNLERMDSFMVSSSCKKLSRIELVYAVNFNLIRALNKIDNSLIPEECESYLKSGDKNEVIYRTKTDETINKLEILINHSILLYDTFLKGNEIVQELEEFKLLKRMIKEQTDYLTTDDKNPKKGSDIKSDSLQNPSDPDATYVKKYGDNTGYTVNVLEQFDGDNGIIKTYGLEKNIYSDTKFSNDIINERPVDSDDAILLVDGAYYSQEISKEAEKKNIKMIPGELKGRKVSKDKLDYNSFVVDEENNLIAECLNKQTPVESYYNEDRKKYKAKFSKEVCKECPFKDKCRKKDQKKYNIVEFTEKQYEISLLRAEMDTQEYLYLKNKRSGVEGIPSVFRRRYHVDVMPIMGEVCSKIWLGFKVAAYNFKKLIKGLPFIVFFLKLIKILEKKLNFKKIIFKVGF